MYQINDICISKLTNLSISRLKKILESNNRTNIENILSKYYLGYIPIVHLLNNDDINICK